MKPSKPTCPKFSKNSGSAKQERNISATALPWTRLAEAVMPGVPSTASNCRTCAPASLPAVWTTRVITSPYTNSGTTWNRPSRSTTSTTSPCTACQTPPSPKPWLLSSRSKTSRFWGMAATAKKRNRSTCSMLHGACMRFAECRCSKSRCGNGSMPTPKPQPPNLEKLSMALHAKYGTNIMHRYSAATTSLFWASTHTPSASRSICRRTHSGRLSSSSSKTTSRTTTLPMK